jgi:uncharacterized protein (TIGR02145 family)
MKKVQFSVLFALLIVGIGLQSCAPEDPKDEVGPPRRSSNSNGGNSSSSSGSSPIMYEYCDFEEDRECMRGTWNDATGCPPGGVLSNDCHYDSSSSAGNNGGNSSSSGEGDPNAPSSSSIVLQEYDFCVYHTLQNCSPGPFTRCPGGGELSDICPFNDPSCSYNPECWEEIVEATVYGDDLTDSRDGKTYKTIVIGSQTWMEYNKLILLSYDLKVIMGAQIWMESNLNFEPSSGMHKCYWQGGGNGQDTYWTAEAAKPNCDKYGRLYDWVTAMDLPSSCATSSCASRVPGKHKGICPTGWHIPSREEWNALKDHIHDVLWWNYEDEERDWDVGTKLKATNGWKANAEHGNGVDTYGFNAIASGYCVNCDNASLTSATGYYAGETAQANWWSTTEFSQPDKAYSFEVTYDKNTMNEKRVEKKDYLYSVRCVKD